MIRNYLLIIISLILLQSCSKKDTEVIPDPEPTGSGTFSYLYNGQFIRIKGATASYRRDTSWGGNYVYIYIRASRSSSENPKTIVLGLLNVNKPGMYAQQAYVSSDIIDKSTWQYSSFATNIELIRLDTVNHIIAGKFNSDMVITRTFVQESWESRPTGLQDTVFIRSGIFDLPLE